MHGRRTASSFSTFLLISVIAASLITGCKSTPKDPYQDVPPEEIYQEGVERLNKRQFPRASQAFESLNTQYPFGDHTESAQLGLIYAYYRSDNPYAALATADDFIALHPTAPEVAYAYYMKGLIKSTENVGLLARVIPLDLTHRDFSNEREAFTYFETLVTRFPSSHYSPDARQRMIALRNDLAQQEINVSRYYMSRKAYVAAANRARFVIEYFPQTPQVYDALEILVDAYEKLGMSDLSQDAEQILLMNVDRPLRKTKARKTAVRETVVPAANETEFVE